MLIKLFVSSNKFPTPQRYQSLFMSEQDLWWWCC